jgi:hypothetical protein
VQIPLAGPPLLGKPEKKCSPGPEPALGGPGTGSCMYVPLGKGDTREPKQKRKMFKKHNCGERNTKIIAIKIERNCEQCFVFYQEGVFIL